MLKTVVKKGSYHDSVVLMLLTNQISTIEGVKKVSIMMATPANKDIYRQSGLATEELEAASANDLVIVADVDDDSLLNTIEDCKPAIIGTGGDFGFFKGYIDNMIDGGWDFTLRGILRAWEFNGDI